jgi:predicted nicotinamide N-methyase
MADEDVELEFDLFEDNGVESTDVCWEPVDLATESNVGVPRLELPRTLAVWGSSIYLSRYLTRHLLTVFGKSVVQLGADVGLPGLVSGALGASSALITDYDRRAVRSATLAAARNGLADTVSAARLDWRDCERPAAERPAGMPSPAEVVIAADCNFESKSVRPLLAAIHTVAAPGALLLLASEEQRVGLAETVAALVAEASEFELSVTLTLLPNGLEYAEISPRSSRGEVHL